MTPKHSRRDDGVIGIIVHKHGTMRLFRNRHGSLYAEVAGFRTGDARDFLSQLDELGDIASEVLVCDAPDFYRAPFDLEPVRHRRRPGS
jgi:hypothetical protein